VRVLFLGSPEFAVPSLKALVEHPQYEVVAVITQPDRKAGRGQRLSSPPVKDFATEAGIPVFQFPRIRGNGEALALLERTQPELMVVVAFGQILPPEFFEFPPHGTLNVHSSLLPKFRGAAPVVHAILSGETESGVTIMRIDEGMDTGDILSQKTVPVPKDMCTGELEEVLAKEGANLLSETLGGYVRGEISPLPQGEKNVSFAPRISKEDARVRWDRNALSVHNLVRAMNPWPVAFALFRDQRVKIWKTTVSGEPPGAPLDVRDGTLVCVEKEQIVVRCSGPSYLSLLTLQLPNRQQVSAGDFINGTQLKVGERLL